MQNYRSVVIACSCYSIEHILKFEYWNDDNLVYITSPMRVDNVWRRFREAFKLIVWGEIDSGLDMLVDTTEMNKLNGFMGHTITEMILAEQAKEAKDGPQQSGGGQ